MSYFDDLNEIPLNHERVKNRLMRRQLDALADDYFGEIPFDNPRRKSRAGEWDADKNTYTFDRNGNRVYPGDYVKCGAKGYLGLKVGERRRVISVSMDTLIMRNDHSPTGSSAYQPRNFTLAERHHPWHKQNKEAQVAKNTLYVALEIGDLSYEQVAELANGAKPNGSRAMWADTSFESLKARLNQRIRSFPDERWLILSGTVLAETSAPPVTFRPV